MSTDGVVVTGANGFLGCHLLAELQSRGFSPLRALVRARDARTAHQKLAHVCEQHRLALRLEEITPIPWDMNQHQLGLDPATRHHLFKGIGTVLHCAAEVNFLSRSDQLQRVNAAGTAQLLGWANEAGVQRWVQMSSLAIFNGSVWPDGIPVPEKPWRGDPNQPVSGYARSKLSAERVCLETIPTSIATCVLRLPYLHASFKTYSANPSGYLDVMLRAVLELGSSFEQDFSYHALPVDQCAEWVVRMTLASHSCESIVHVMAEPTLHWHAWLDAAQANGNPLRLVPMPAWFEGLRQQAAITKSRSLLAAYAFLSLEASHERWMQANAHRLKFDRQNLCAMVPEARRELELPSHYMQAVLKNLAGNHTRPDMSPNSNTPSEALLGPTLWNWNQTRQTTPSRLIVANNVTTVQDIVGHPELYPGPVLAIGSMHSVTDAVLNDAGTIIDLTGLNQILGLEDEASEQPMVRVQAGCKLKDVSAWLAKRGFELAFQAEIGNATIGALTTGDSKDAIHDGPGYFSAYVRQVTFINEQGEQVTIDQHSNPKALAEFRCSFGLQGIAVECLISVQRLRLFCTHFSANRFESISELCTAIQAKVKHDYSLQGNLLIPELVGSFAERHVADAGTRQSLEMQAQTETFRLQRQRFVAHGGAADRPQFPEKLIHHRWQLINDFEPVNPSQPRLDFQLYEHDLTTLEQVLSTTAQAVTAFHAKTGFKPNGWAFYVVHRSETGAKPYGLYSGGPGISIVLDPYTSDPFNEHWVEFCKQYNRIATKELGARVSPTQTQWLTRGDCVIPQALVQPRFLSSYYQTFSSTAGCASTK